MCVRGGECTEGQPRCLCGQCVCMCAMARSSLFARSGSCMHKSLCLCVSVSYVHQSKVTVLADA